MNAHLLALQLMALQGVLGAFDTVFHHELSEGLAGRDSAGRELAIHSARALLYALLFVGLSFWAWHGLWAGLLLAVFGVEIVLTLWDFVVEDRSRQLPASERITHTVLAMNGGAFVLLLALTAGQWWQAPTGLVWQDHGALGWFLFACGVGVALSGLRDGLAALAIGRRLRAAAVAPALHFGGAPQQVLVTGATGFIGQRLVRALLADGHAVTVLTRTPRQAAMLFDGRVRAFGGVEHLPHWPPMDVVINLAGARILGWRWSARRKAQLRRSRVALTAALVDWIARAPHKPRLLLSASAIGYYGIQARGDATVLTEDAGPQPIFMSDMCREWETAAAVARTHGVQVACMRFGLVLGHQGALPMMLLPIRLGLGGPLAGGSQWLSWIHVDDLLGAIAHLWQLPRVAPAYNFTAPECLPQSQFSAVAAAALHRPCLLPTPGWPMRLALGEQADLLLEGQRVAPARLLASGFAFRYATLAPALRSLV